jgi:hypothetical protein
MEPIIAKYRWTAEERATAMHWWLRQSMRPIFRVGLGVLIAFILIVGVHITLYESRTKGAAIIAIGFGMSLWLTPWARWLALLPFRRPFQPVEIELCISDANIQLISPRSAQAEWDAFFKTVRTPEGLLLFFKSKHFEWIPRSGFTSEADFEAATALAEKNCPRFFRVGEGSVFKCIRFNVRNLLWTTFWVCVWGGALAHLRTWVPSHRPLQQLSWWTMLVAVWSPLFLVIWTPAVAIGALFSRTRLGAIVGLGFVAFAALMVLLVAL